MIDLASLPLFIGPVEMMLVGAVILVLLFGSRATDMAREAGSAAGKVRSTRAKAEKEIDDVRSDIEEGVEPIKEEVEAVEEEVETVEEEVETVEEDLKSVEEDMTLDDNPGGAGGSPAEE